MVGDLTQGARAAQGARCATLWRMVKLRRLWQPRKPLFWMMLGFNALSSVCSWAMRTQPLSTLGLLMVGSIALLNVAFGLLAAWRLMQSE